MPAGPITRYEINGGIRVYRIPVRAFPMLIAHVHVVIAGDYAALIDTGSGLGDSNTQLEAGLAEMSTAWGERLGWGDIKRVVITHSHIDHYGGLGFVLSRTSAPVAVHELDRRVLTNHQERLVTSSRALATFLERAGLSEESRDRLIALYGWSKGLFRSVEIETVLHDGDILDKLFHIHHVPGHCPGQVCLQLGDVLLSADHVLPRTSPHLAPESITPSTGLDHYLAALRSISAVPGIRLALGGHEEPIGDFYGLICDIERSQQRKLERVREACAEPRTIKEITCALYPRVEGYDVLLALEKVGAYIEYLDQRGELAIANLDDLERDHRVAPRYRRLS